MSCTSTLLNTLDKIQRRALRLVQDGPPTPHIDSLEHRRDVGALVVFHKTQIQRVPQLASLRLPTNANQRCTRMVNSGRILVEVPRSWSCQHQRSFAASTSRLWNKFTASVDVEDLNTQQVKLAAHRWRSTHPGPLRLHYGL